jgi:Domain of unknown function (DUF3786)
MPTGVCGINCDACKLCLLGTCSSCGPGTSLEAEKKLEVQQRLLGGPCPILACAQMNHVTYCLRDCNAFPCENFSRGPYPFSQGFLNMQARRRREIPPAFAPNRTRVQVPEEFWDALQHRDPIDLCNLTLFSPVPDRQLMFSFLHENIIVDLGQRCLKRMKAGAWQATDDPLLELVTLVYLNNVRQMVPVGRDIVGAKDLKEAHFFQGPHALPLDALLTRYGRDVPGFRQAAEFLKGQPADMADITYRLLPFPRIPLYYLLWEGDREFEPRMSVLFDRSIEAVFPADAIWGLVNRVTTALLTGPADTGVME